MTLLDDACPKRGVITLYPKYLEGAPGDEWTEALEFPTSCKTWSCPVCQRKLSAYVRMVAEYGLLTAEHSEFTTCTFALPATSRRTRTPKRSPRDSRRNSVLPNYFSDNLENAHSVARVWARFLSKLSPSLPNLAWMKVIEMTAQQQPHLHLLITSSAPIPASWRYNVTIWWYWATFGGSWITHSEEVKNPYKTAAYLCKYLAKTFGDRRALQAAGFSRRYSRSRNWPVERMRLLGTLYELWMPSREINRRKVSPHKWRKGDAHDWRGRAASTADHPLAVRVGTDLAKLLEQRRLTERTKHQIRKVRSLSDV